MPAVAVIGGIASAMGAAAGATALIGGTITLSTVASGLAFVGGIASALGGLTGNKKLMKFGMIAGLAGAAAGGIGSLMSNAGDAAANVAGSASSGIMGPPTELGQLDSLGNMPLSDTSNALELSSAGMAGDVANSPGMAGQGLQAPSLASETATTAVKAPAVSAPDPSAGVDYAINKPGGGILSQSFNGELAGARAALTGPAAPSVSMDTSAFSKLGGLLKSNPELMKVGSQAIAGMGQSYMQGQQLKEQERLAAERRARMNQSILGQRYTN